MPPDRVYRKLIQRIDLHARQILLQIAIPLDETLAVPPAVDEDHIVTIVVSPASAGEVVVEKIPGRFLSDAEARVWECMRPGEWLVGKEIAARLGRKYDDPRFKGLLANLADRGVLEHDDDHDKGFRRAVPPPAGDATARCQSG